MSSTERVLSSKFFQPASSPMRLKLLRLIHTHGELSYTEMMKLLNLDPNRDAGRFAYHLRTLLKAELIGYEPRRHRYFLTEAGQTLISFCDETEELLRKRRQKLLVRTSRFAIESFDRKKISKALMREAGIPSDLAERIARETEDRISAIGVRYLTAPLIRELVNAILIEKGLEEYRHKLTRLGMPVYDVTKAIKSAGEARLSVETIPRMAGKKVLEEYVLLAILPRDVADAHLSGSLHICNIEDWTLRPREIWHDVRTYLQGGLDYPPPKTPEALLSLISTLTATLSSEQSGESTLDHFNVFLAPVMKGLPSERILDTVSLFIFELSQAGKVSIGLDTIVPDHLREEEAASLGGRATGKYGDFEEESREIFDAVVSATSEDYLHRPITNPSIVIKVYPEVFKDKDLEQSLLKAHELALKYGTPFFVNQSWQAKASYSSSSSRLSDDWTGDWELDSLRTGVLGDVTVNLPRIAYEARGDVDRFFKLTEERLEMARRALDIKYRNLEGRLSQGMMPLLSRTIRGEAYYRLKNSTRSISILGLSEAVEVQTKSPLHDKSAFDFALEVMKLVNSFTRKHSRKPNVRIVSSQASEEEAAPRMATLDLERFGLANVRVRGTKENPFYTTVPIIPLEEEVPLSDRMKIEGAIHELLTGGHLSTFDVGRRDIDELLSMTKKICQESRIGFFAYNRSLVYCQICQKIFYVDEPKCPSCKSDILVRYKRLVTRQRIV